MRFFALAAALLAAASPAAVSSQDSVQLTLPDPVPAKAFSGKRSEHALMAQVLLDRSRFSPGVIDGVMGSNTRRAIEAYQRANGMTVDGKISAKLLRALMQANSGAVFQMYTISRSDTDGPFVEVPSGMAEMAKLDTLAFETPRELLAEKFHMDQDFLAALNPGADFGKAGTKIVVIAPGEQKLTGQIDRIEVDKGKASLRVYASDGALLARYPATVGSNRFPSPSGAMEVRAVAANAKYYFDPEGREWGPDEKLTIAAGPNNPIGTAWIDLSKDGYGIHGSPDPNLIGKTASHGCVRLTNWDVQELAAAVGKGVKVEFV